MRVTCPNCGALYELPEIVAARARRMRCACCDATWATQYAPPVPTTDWEVLAEPTADRAMPHGAPDKAQPASSVGRKATPESGAPASVMSVANDPTGPIGTRRLWTGAWAGTGVFLVGAGAACWHWQEVLTRAWPPLARVFAGLHGVV